MCGILNKGFASLGSDMQNLRSSLDTQMNSLSDSLENNFQELWGFEEDVDAWLDVDGSEAEPPPPTRFQFRAEHELSDEDEDNEVLDNGNGGANPGAANLNIMHVDPCEGESFFARFNRSVQVPTGVGDDLDSNLAGLVNHIFEHPLNTEDFVRLKEGTLRPGNCTQLQVPPVPEAIWVKVSGELKGRDKATQKLHGDFLCLFKVLRVLNKCHNLVSVCPQLQGPVEELTEALRIAGYIHRIGLIKSRREVLKPDLPGEFKRLAGAAFPPCPSSLFGDNLVENVKSISEVARLSDKMAAVGKNKSSQQPGRGRYHPYARGRPNSFRRGRGGRGRG